MRQWENRKFFHLFIIQTFFFLSFDRKRFLLQKFWLKSCSKSSPPPSSFSLSKNPFICTNFTKCFVSYPGQNSNPLLNSNSLFLIPIQSPFRFKTLLKLYRVTVWIVWIVVSGQNLHMKEPKGGNDRLSRGSRSLKCRRWPHRLNTTTFHFKLTLNAARRSSHHPQSWEYRVTRFLWPGLVGFVQNLVTLGGEKGREFWEFFQKPISLLPLMSNRRLTLFYPFLFTQRDLISLSLSLAMCTLGKSRILLASIIRLGFLKT